MVPFCPFFNLIKLRLKLNMGIILPVIAVYKPVQLLSGAICSF